MQTIKIETEEPKIDVNAALDLFGRQFKFDHAKGLSEWLKNSVDAYNIANVHDDNQIILITIWEGIRQNINRVDVLDFVGMSKGKIDEGFKNWFSPTAAKLTNEKIKAAGKTFGGHGNGGKFYMRQMFNTSNAITYYDGRLSVFGFDESRNYGYSKIYNDLMLDSDEAMQIAGISERNVPYKWIEGVKNKENGFTLIDGIGPRKSAGTSHVYKLIEKLIMNPQARRMIKHKQVWIQIMPEGKMIKLAVPEIKPKHGFEPPKIYKCDDKLKLGGKDIPMINKRYLENIELKLYSSEEQLTGHKYRELNAIDFIGEVGVIASYQIHEIGTFRTAYTDFIYGECTSPIMEDPEDDCVQNDREIFIRSNKTIVLKQWIESCILDYAMQMEGKQQKERKKHNLMETANYNKILNTWKNNFMKKIIREQLAGLGEQIGIGGEGGEGPVIGAGKGKGMGKKGKKKSGDTGGSEKRKKPIHPTVLISSIDKDPLSDDDSTFNCDPRHPAVHQRPKDTEYGLYWINTSKQLANYILGRDGADSSRWRLYLFQRHVDIIIKETIYLLERKEINLTADDVNRRIDEINSSIIDKAAEDLKEFLFSEKYKA